MERDAERRDAMIGVIGGEILASAKRRAQVERFRKVSMFAAAAAVVLAIGAGVRLHQVSESGNGAASGATLQGTAVLVRGDETKKLESTQAFALRSGEQIQTSADGEAKLQMRETELRIGPASKLSVPASTNALEERLSLAVGRVDVSVKKNAAERRVVIETPTAEVVMRGTHFSVNVSSTAGHVTTTKVAAAQGSVWIVVKGERVATLKAGDEWTSARDGKAEDVASLDATAETQRKTELTGKSSVPRGARQRATSPATPAETGTLAEENQLFQTALDARNRGNDARAVELFDKLLSRFPRSALGEEAQVERFRALKRLGKNQHAAAAARRYLAGHKSGFARDEARNMALGSD
jgi:hypothetical protein